MILTSATMRSIFLTISPLFFFLLTILASTVTEPRPTPILIRHDNQSSDLVSAISDMRRESYYGFVTLLHILNDTDFFRSQEITFLMPNDEDISQADMAQESLETFILRHAIPAWLMINHMVRFPNKTLVPCSIPDRMFTITKSGGSGLFVNNARIVSPNICQNSRISCHGISNVITFNEDSFPKGRLSPKMLSSRINSSRHWNFLLLSHQLWRVWRCSNMLFKKIIRVVDLSKKSCNRAAVWPINSRLCFPLWRSDSNY